MRRLYNIALSKSLTEALKRKNFDIIKNIIKTGIDSGYVDSKGRNFIMIAVKYDCEKRLEIISMLIEAGCDINHLDKQGWTCLQYACNVSASGALEVVELLIKRGSKVSYNQLGYGPDDLIIPKTTKANSLLQHTEQVVKDGNIKRSWEIFKNYADQQGYSIVAPKEVFLGSPIKIGFRAPENHNVLDRIRIVNLYGRNAIWMQNDHTVSVPPGNVGTVTLDNEMISLPSMYRCIYEKFEPKVSEYYTENNIEAQVFESRCNLDNRKLQEGIVVGDNETKYSMSIDKCSIQKHEELQEIVYNERKGRCQSEQFDAAKEQESKENMIEELAIKNNSEEELNISQQPKVSERYAVRAADFSLNAASTFKDGFMTIVAMCDLQVKKDTRLIADTNEYEVIIQTSGKIGLTLEPHYDGSKQTNKVVVKASHGQAANVQPGDLLISINNTSVEHAGFKHTVWKLGDAMDRPLILRFRRGNLYVKKSLFQHFRLSNLQKTRTVEI